VAELDPALTAQCDSLEGKFEEHLSPLRLAALGASLLGILAGVLALTGVYGLAAHTANWQAKECAIRIAFGSDRGGVLAMMVTQCMRPVVVGIGTGLLAAPFVLGWMRSLLFGLSPTDPLSLAFAAALLCAAALAAVFAPAWRVSRSAPMLSLRHE
jgi:hypothetical protein